LSAISTSPTGAAAAGEQFGRDVAFLALGRVRQRAGPGIHGEEAV
jgi:hypothetical protein